MYVRQILPSDEGSYRNILSRTTDEDRYCRFFHFVDHFDVSEIRRYVDLRDDTAGYIAFDGTEPLGSAHAIIVSPGVRELAVVVARESRGRGVASALLRVIVDDLKRRNDRELIALSLPTNLAFVRLARSIGMKPKGSDGFAVTWSLDLVFSNTQGVRLEIEGASVHES